MKTGVSEYLRRILLICILPGIFYSGCTGTKPVTESVRFALFGNTYPDSPFSGFNTTLPELLGEIETYKPQIIIHTGDALYGGSETEGILETDLKRQMNIFFPTLEKLHTAVYTIPGDRDYHNGTPDLYLDFSGKRESYSFNYGSIHFICLSSSDAGDSFIDTKQLKWLKKDLNAFRDSNAIFVFAHHPMFPDKKKNKTSQDNESLHSLFLKYNVRAVFSGTDDDYTMKIKDSIRYINAGSYGNSDKKSRKKSSRFYIVNFFKNELTIDPVK